MTKRRKTIQPKIRAALQKEINSECPFCQNGDIGHFVVHHIDENPDNNKPKNLLMVCPICHSKITKGDISQTEVLGVKNTLRKMNEIREKPTSKQGHTICGDVNQSVFGDNNIVTYNLRSTQKSKYPDGCIGHEISKANYISYLITRYHEYKEWEVGKEQMRYGLFPSRLKKRYKIGKQRTIYHLPVNKFGDLSEYIQSRISDTTLAKINRGKGQEKCFQTYEEYIRDHG